MSVGLLFFVLLALVACAIFPGQRESLHILYNATGGPFWTNSTNWNTMIDPCSTPSIWFGVICDQQQENVLKITLQDNNLTGSLPDLQLPSLEIL